MEPPLERICNYAEAHLDKARRLLDEADQILMELQEQWSIASNNYQSTIMKGNLYVPVDFIRADNDFRGIKMRLVEKQNQILLNLNYTLSFCAEMVSFIIQNKTENTLAYRRKIRLLVERSFEICKSRGMRRASLATLITECTRMECLIVMNEAIYFGALRRTLREFRLEMA